MIKTIVFDFGNVIGFFDHWRASRRIAARAGVPVEVIHAFLFDGRLEDDYEAGKITTAEYLKAIRDKFGLSCPDELLAADYADIFWPNPDVCSMLPRLKPRFRLLLGSNTCELHYRKFSHQFADTLGYFDGLALSYEIGARKPAAVFFQTCRGLAGCAARECVFIDDLAANVAGAQACGWHGIIYTGIDDLRRRLAALDIPLSV